MHIVNSDYIIKDYVLIIFVYRVFSFDCKDMDFNTIYCLIHIVVTTNFSRTFRNLVQAKKFKKKGSISLAS